MSWVLFWCFPLWSLLLVELIFGFALGPTQILRRNEPGSGYWYIIIFHTVLLVMIATVILYYLTL